MHLVTGGSGYLGEVIVQHLLKQGLPVRILDLNPPDSAQSKNIEVIIGDIRDKNAVTQACTGVTHIYHNVAQVPLAKNKHLFDSVNREGTRILLQTALDQGVKKVVYTSSSAIYGVPEKNPVTEETLAKPGEAYGQAKLEGENLCHEFSAKGLDVSIIRPRTILGHGRLGIFQILFEWIYQGYNIPILGDGNNVYQFIHADDLARACILAAFHPGSNNFNIGAAKFGTMRETLEALIQHTKTRSKIRSLPAGPLNKLMRLCNTLQLSPLGPYHALMYSKSLYFNIRKAQKVLQWQPRYSNIEMICESYDWYVNHREEVLKRNQASAHRSAVKQGILKLVRFLP